MDKKKIKILGIAGSLRKNAYSCYALEAAKKLLPDNAELTRFDIKDIPAFDQDIENNPPEIVKRFKEEIRNSDAILFSTPEYNFSVPGVLKNAIDWASRPYGDNAWEGKPAGIMSVSAGMFGGVRAQYHLRQIFVFLNIQTPNKPEVFIANESGKFDEAGNLTDEHTGEKIRELIEALIKLTEKLR